MNEASGWFNLAYPGWQLFLALGVLAILAVVIIFIAVAMLSGQAPASGKEHKDWEKINGKK